IACASPGVRGKRGCPAHYPAPAIRLEDVVNRTHTLDMKVEYNAYSEDLYVPRRWHHVVAQKNGSRMELYFDGVAARPLPLEADYPTLSCNLVVGRRTPDTKDLKDSRSFVGRLDELAIYDHTLSVE